jgi:hypothetical protein
MMSMQDAVDRLEARRQVYVILRVDSFQEADVPMERKVTAKKVVWSEEVARAEVERLNALQSDRGSYYFWQLSRLESALAEAGTSSHEFTTQAPPSP